MPSCVCIPVAFQELLPRKITKGDLLDRLYSELAAIALNRQINSQDLPYVTETIPLGFEYQRDGKYACTVLEERLRHTNDDTELLILDCTAYMRKVTEHWFVLFLANIAVYMAERWRIDGRTGRVMFLLPQSLHEKDPNWLAIVESLSKLEGGLVIREDGATAISNGDWSSSHAEKYADLLRAYREKQRLTSIAAATLRRIGSFSFSKPGRQVFDTCISIDGSKVQPELATQIVARLTREPEDPFDAIVFHDAALQWMDATRFFLDDRLAELSISVPILVCKTSDDLAFTSQHKKILIVTPLIDGGSTVKSLYDAAKQNNPKAQIDILGLFSTDGDLQLLGVRLLKGGLSCEYIMRIERRDSQLSKYYKLISPQCTMPDSFSAEPAQLSSLSFWLMCLEAGFEHETPIPGGRDSLGYVPRFGKLFKSNAAWLAAKVARLIEREKLMDVAVLCPDEPNAKELAATLRNVFNCAVIEVPREALADAANASDVSGIFENLKKKKYLGPHGRDWIAQLETFSGYKLNQAKVYIMDEFSISRRTLLGLSRLAESLDLQVAGAVLLVDFSGRPDEKVQHIKSLYRIPLDVRRAERPVS